MMSLKEIFDDRSLLSFTIYLNSSNYSCIAFLSCVIFLLIFEFSIVIFRMTLIKIDWRQTVELLHEN